MRTCKIEALHRLIDWLNNKFNKKIKKYGLDPSSLYSNPWLAGFIEADGNFYVGFEYNSDGAIKNVKCYMRITKKNL